MHSVLQPQSRCTRSSEGPARSPRWCVVVMPTIIPPASDSYPSKVGMPRAPLRGVLRGGIPGRWRGAQSRRSDLERGSARPPLPVRAESRGGRHHWRFAGTAGRSRVARSSRALGSSTPARRRTPVRTRAGRDDLGQRVWNTCGGGDPAAPAATVLLGDVRMTLARPAESAARREAPGSFARGRSHGSSQDGA